MANGPSVPLGEALVAIRVDTASLRRQLGAAQRVVSDTVQNMGARLGAIGASLTKSVTLPLVGLGAATAKIATDFDRAGKRMQAVVGLTSKEVAAFKSQVLDLATATGVGPQALQEAMERVTSAGQRGATAIATLDAAARASAAGLGDVSAIALTVTAAMEAYGSETLDAATATGQLVAAVREGNAEASSLAPVLGRVLPIAAALGVEFNEVGAAIAAMTRLGTSASESVTALKGVFSAIIKPSTQAAQAFEDMGISLDDVRTMLAEDGLLATLQFLSDAVDGNVDALAELFPNVEGLVGVLGLVGKNAAGVNGIFGRMARSGIPELGAAFKAVQGPGFEMDRALASIQVAMIRLGDAVLPVLVPAIIKMSEVVSGLAERFAGLSPTMKTAIVLGAALAAALGPLALAAGAVLVALPALGAGLAALLSPIGLVVAAIVGAGGLIAAFVLMPESVKAALGEFWAAIVQVFDRNLRRVPGLVRSILGEISPAFLQVSDESSNALRTLASNASTFLVDTFNNLLAPIRGALQPILNIFETFRTEVTNRLIDLRNAVFTWLLEKIEPIVNKVFALWAKVQQFWNELWGDMATTVAVQTVNIIGTLTKEVSRATSKFTELGAAASGAMAPGVPGALSPLIGGQTGAPGEQPGALPGLGLDTSPAGPGTDAMAALGDTLTAAASQMDQFAIASDGASESLANFVETASGKGAGKGLPTAGGEGGGAPGGAGGGGFFGGLVDGITAAGKGMSDLAAVGKKLGQSLAQGIGGAFTSIVMGTKSAKQAFKEFAVTFLTNIVQMIAQAAVLALLTSIFSGGSTAATGATSFTSAFTSALTGLSGITQAAPRNRLGGSYVVGGQSTGPDSAFVLARATPGEMVTFTPRSAAASPGGAAGVGPAQPTVNIVINEGAGTKGMVTSSNSANGVTEVVIETVRADLRSGGRTADAIEAATGSTRPPRST